MSDFRKLIIAFTLVLALFGLALGLYLGLKDGAEPEPNDLPSLTYSINRDVNTLKNILKITSEAATSTQQISFEVNADFSPDNLHVSDDGKCAIVQTSDNNPNHLLSNTLLLDSETVWFRSQEMNPQDYPIEVSDLVDYAAVYNPLVPKGDRLDLYIDVVDTHFISNTGFFLQFSDDTPAWIRSGRKNQMELAAFYDNQLYYKQNQSSNSKRQMSRKRNND